MHIIWSRLALGGTREQYGLCLTGRVSLRGSGSGQPVSAGKVCINMRAIILLCLASVVAVLVVSANYEAQVVSIDRRHAQDPAKIKMGVREKIWFSTDITGWATLHFATVQVSPWTVPGTKVPCSLAPDWLFFLSTTNPGFFYMQPWTVYNYESYPIALQLPNIPNLIGFRFCVQGMLWDMNFRAPILPTMEVLALTVI
jgi:hypothetical protein